MIHESIHGSIGPGSEGEEYGGKDSSVGADIGVGTGSNLKGPNTLRSIEQDLQDGDDDVGRGSPGPRWQTISPKET